MNEVMHGTNFPGLLAWCYDSVNLFAPIRLHNEPDDMRKFINAALSNARYAMHKFHLDCRRPEATPEICDHSLRHILTELTVATAFPPRYLSAGHGDRLMVASLGTNLLRSRGTEPLHSPVHGTPTRMTIGSEAEGE